MKKQIIKKLVTVLVLMLGISMIAAPGTISYKGRLLDKNENVINSNGLAIKFLFYSDLVGGTLLYQDWHDGSDIDHPLVSVQDGFYTAIIGDDTTNHSGATFTSLSDALNFDDSIFIEIVIDSIVLTPREKLQAVPFAINAGNASSSNANRELNNLQNVAVNTSILPGTDNNIDLGSETKKWKDLFIKGNLNDGINSVDIANIVTKNGSQTLTNKTIVPSDNIIQLDSAKILIGNNLNKAEGVEMTGDVVIDNTGTTTIQPNSVTLGTDTNGAYIKTLSDAGGTTIIGSGGETAEVTIKVNVDNFGIEINNNSLQLKDNGITTDKINNSAVTTDKIANETIVNSNISTLAGITDNKLAQITTLNKVAGSAVQLNNIGGIENNDGLKIKEATGSGLTIDSNGIRITISNNLNAIIPPTKDNDINDILSPNGIGYSIGSIWIDVTNKNQYICIDNNDGAAIWRLVTLLEKQKNEGGNYINRSLPGGWL